MKAITEQQALGYLKNEMPDWDAMDKTVQETILLAFQIGHNVGALAGYDEGFQVALAAERGIKAVERKISELEAGQDAMDVICGNLKQ